MIAEPNQPDDDHDDHICHDCLPAHLLKVGHALGEAVCEIAVQLERIATALERGNPG